MGKRTQAGNKAAKLERQAQMLKTLTEMIGKLSGERRECIEASALFAATAGRLNIPVELRAVSILAIDTKTQKVALTGVAAAEYAESRGATTFGAPADVSESSFERAGHMIVCSEQLSMIFDPTFQQFARDGLPNTVASGRVPDVRPADGRLDLAMLDGRVEITYFFDDANTGWQADVEAVLPAWSAAADRLATHLLSGGSAADLPFEVPWDEHSAC